jgi:hypothetical protein
MKNIKIHHIGIKRHAKALREQGFSEEQMESILEFIQEVLDYHISDMAKKSDIKILGEKLEKIEMRLVIKLGGIISFWASVLATLIKV